MDVLVGFLTRSRRGAVSLVFFVTFFCFGDIICLETLLSFGGTFGNFREGDGIGCCLRRIPGKEARGTVSPAEYAAAAHLHFTSPTNVIIPENTRDSAKGLFNALMRLTGIGQTFLWIFDTW